ncbi:cytochrome c-type biogenesis protein [Roseobacter sp. HKCCA0882]|jgi:cytochrome c-type biogenesis protein CcmH|uniref:cytochrome c-type biogenesis protein n=1 Tax=Roseobacter sp. HKCCA0882 TaxID=3120337 RepID=UPI0030EDF629
MTRALVKAALAAVWLIATPALAVQPDEVLPDPALEARAREISADLRCVVCRNESIDESNATVARDLRIFVRERIMMGDSNEQVIAEVVDRYGEYVLMRPPMSGSNLALWLAGPALLLLGFGVAFAFIRTRARSTNPTEAELTPEEQAALARILGDKQS